MKSEQSQSRTDPRRTAFEFHYRNRYRWCHCHDCDLGTVPQRHHVAARCRVRSGGFILHHLRLLSAEWAQMIRVALMGLVLLVSGCATLEKIVTPAAAPFVQAAVDAAVATAVTKGVSAAKIKTIASEILAADTGTQVALSAIESIINQKLVALNLPPADLAAAEILTATLTGIIQLQLTGTAATAITAQTQIAVADIMNDLIVATSAYGV